MSRTLPIPYPDHLDFKTQSVEVPGTKRPGQTGHYRNAAFPLVTLESPGAFQTLLDVWDEGFARSRDKPMLGYRPVVSTNPLQYANHFVWESWAEVDVRRRAIGSALHTWFQDGSLGGGELPSVGVWSKNTPAWQHIDLAVHAYGKVGVSLYDTLGKDAVEYIINHAEITVVFAQSQHIPSLLKISPRTPQLKMIVSMTPLSPEEKRILVAWGQDRNIAVKDMPEVEAFGKAHLIDPLPATSDQIVTICYTSGTTGNPKGVVLTHGNLANATHAQLHGLRKPPGVDIVVLSFLPLAHIFERNIELNVMAIGGSIGFSCGDPLRFLEDMQILKPTLLASIPRVLNRIYQLGMTVAASPGLKGKLFNRALAAKLQRLHETGEITHAFWDRIVFSQIQKVLGGKLEVTACGAAPISAEAMDFLKISIGGDVIEGDYGMTENCGVCTHVLPGDPSASGTVGPPHANTEIKLLDVPEMGYTSEDKPNPRGELCMRGDHCFKQYYKDPVNTKATVDAEGWIHTGDVAQIDSYNRIKIIDRVKNIMKLSQGEYVAVEKVESMYASSPVLAQIFVYGDSLQSYLVAVVVPDPVHLARIASDVFGTPVSPDDGATLVRAAKSPQVSSALLTELTAVAKKYGLNGFETVKRIHISLDPFTIENNCLTPTMKLRRKDAYAKFKAEIDALYALPEPTSAKL